MNERFPMSPFSSPHNQRGAGVARPRLLAVFAGMLALLVLIAACGTVEVPTAIPTNTPTPTPSPTPTPVPDPIVNLSEDSTYADLAALLPQDAVDCLVSALGQAAYDGLLTQPLFAGDIDFSSDLPLDCITEDVAISVFIATLAQAAGGLSDDTVSCIRNTFEGFGVSQLAELATGELGGEGLSDIFGVGVALLLCLSDDEAEQITAGGLLGDVGGLSAVSLADIRCILSTVDLGDLMGLVSTIEAGGMPDLDTSLGLLTSFNDCGLSLDDLSGGGEGDDPLMDVGSIIDDIPQVLPGTLDDIDLADIDLRNLEGITPELQVQITCVVDAMGDENLSGMVAGTYTPTLQDIIAFSTCGLDLAQLSDLSAAIGG
jgi:hypothetical protein